MNTRASEIELLGEMKEVFCIASESSNETLYLKIKKLDKLYHKLIPILLEKGLTDIKSMPKNQPDFLKFLKELTVGDLFSELLTDRRYEKEKVLDGDVLSIEAERLVEDTNFIERLQAEILTIREIIKNSGLPNEQYEYCRLFFSPQNALMESKELTKALRDSKIATSLINEMRDRFYVKRQYSGDVKICPICASHWQSNHFEENPLCKELSLELGVNQAITKTFKSNQTVFELNESSRRYTLIPNVGESLLKERLLSKYKGIDVVMYPNLDEYDLKVTYKGDTIMLDGKDYKAPEGLATYFNENRHAKKKLTAPGKGKSYVVVMDYRTRLEPNYMNRLKGKLKDATGELQDYFISESDLYDLLDRM